MRKVGTLKVETWPRQMGGTKSFLMDIVKAAQLGKRRCGVVVIGHYTESEIERRLKSLVHSGGFCENDHESIPLSDSNIEILFELPLPMNYDQLFVMIEGDQIPFDRLCQYTLVGIDVRIFRIYDFEVERYV